MRKKCENCNKFFDTDYTFCPYCMNKLISVFSFDDLFDEDNDLKSKYRKYENDFCTIDFKKLKEENLFIIISEIANNLKDYDGKPTLEIDNESYDIPIPIVYLYNHFVVENLDSKVIADLLCFKDIDTSIFTKQLKGIKEIYKIYEELPYDIKLKLELENK